MKKVLIAVDATKGSKSVMSVFKTMVRPPEEVVLLHVEKVGGKSLMYDMLGDAELATLRESVRGTEYGETMQRNTEKILAYYKRELEADGNRNIKTVVRQGHPSEEILKVAEEEGVDMMVLGCNGKSRVHKLISGCVTKDVEKAAKVPVLVAKTTGCEKFECKEAEEAYAAG